MKAFAWKGTLYVRLVPSKPLFHSTMVHEVVNRGDVFAMRLPDQVLTIVPGTAEVIHLELPLDITAFISSKTPPAIRDLFEQELPL